MSPIFCLVIGLILQVNDFDRQTVGSADTKLTMRSAETLVAPVAEEPLVEKVVETFSSLGELPKKIQQAGAVASMTASAMPETLVWVRMSKDYLEDQVTRKVDRTKPVRDYVLGTTIRGKSRTTGDTRLVLRHDDSRAVAEVEFVGEVHARTTGYNAPATLQYLSDSTFRARKRLVIGEAGLGAMPATAEAPTRLTPTQIQTSLPGLRGRIAERIAWRRVRSSQSQADAIVSDHTADDIRNDLDKKLDATVAKVQAKVQGQLAQLKLDDEPIMRSRSTPDYIEVALCLGGSNNVDWQAKEFAVEGNPEIAVRLHRSLIAHVLADSELRQKFAPLLGIALVGSIESATGALTDKTAQLQPSKWSLNGEWVALEFDGRPAEESEPAMAVAAAESASEPTLK